MEGRPLGIGWPRSQGLKKETELGGAEREEGSVQGQLAPRPRSSKLGGLKGETGGRQHREVLHPVEGPGLCGQGAGLFL